MSWKSYVDDNLVATGKVAKASIFGHDGSLWASSADFKIGAEEAKKLIAAFDDPSGIQASGLYLEGQKYIFLRPADTPTCKAFYARNGATGVTCVKTNQAVLVGYYNENMQAGDCNTVVQNLGEYLYGTGY